jgi:adenylate cyclase class 2
MGLGSAPILRTEDRVESEMKVPVASLEDVRRRLTELDAKQLEGEAAEENWVFDDDHGTLVGANLLLRVRRWGERGWLTYKGPASYAGGVKSREEVECAVADAGLVIDILTRIGMRIVRRYEKRRETWRLGDVEVALDVTPMGSFVELEGPATGLVEGAKTLGLDPARAVRGTYLELWREYRRSHPGAPDDMVFA